MSLSKEFFEKAKRNALDRLTGWITDKKHENDGGIPRLQEDFKHAFRKIAWRKKGTRENLPLRNENAKKEQKKKNKQSDNGKKSQKKAKVKKDVPIVSSEHRQVFPQVFDSNSSNVSSRLDTRSDIKSKSRRSTPVKSRHGTPAEFLQKTIKDNLDLELENDTSFRETRTRDAQADTVPQKEELRPQIPRRKKKKKSKKQHESLSAETTTAGPEFSVQVDTAEVHGADEASTEAKNTLSTMEPPASLGTSPSFPTHIKVKTGGHDLVLKRTSKQKRASNAADLAARAEEKPLGSEEKRKQLLARFRRVVWLLIHVRVLLNVSRIRIEEEEKEKTKGFKGDDGSELTFDATIFKTAMTSYGGLTSRARKALNKTPAERNEEDAYILMEVMLRLPTFAKYPKQLKQDLAKMLWYDKFEKGRVIVKQGDPGTRMYFVVSGSGVSLRRTDRYDEDGYPVSYHYRSVGPGSTFGELALIRDMKRDYTAVCTVRLTYPNTDWNNALFSNELECSHRLLLGPSEFLSLSKSEFNTVLRNRWEKECNIRYNFLRSCEYFRSWTEHQLQACADSAELKEYRDNKIILGDGIKLPDSVFFILRGRCEIVKRIMMVKHHSPYLRSTILLPSMARQRPDFLNKPYGQKLRSMREEYVYLTITTLESGCYFGVGEDLTDIFILSKGKTECVIINSAQFSIQGKSELLRTLKRDREAVLPSNSELYRKFQLNRKWNNYRQQLVNDILARKRNHFSRSYVQL